MSAPPKDFQQDFPNFSFQGFGSTGYCFLRIKGVGRDNGLYSFVILCAQLKNYYGTSVTNAIEEIAQRVVDQLRQEGRVPKKRTFFSRKGASFGEVIERSKWVEYYPPQTGIDPDGSYAVVTFDDEFHPSWNYVSRPSAAEICEVEESFFDISSDDLNHAKQAV